MPLKIMSCRSPIAASPSMGATSFDTGRLSPVSAASAVCSAVASTRRASAGIVSPSSTRMTSPGTSSDAGTCRRSPPRTTVASSADMARRAVTARSARASCT